MHPAPSPASTGVKLAGVTYRFGAVQFEVGLDPAANLRTCVAMIDDAASHKMDVLVLPEFCNALTWYENHEQAYALAIDLDGPWLAEIRAAATRHRMHIKLNCTVRRGQFSGQAQAITSTNILIGSDGQLLAEGDKQILMGNENAHMVRATACTPVVETPFGRLGLYCCMDGVIPEVARSLALRGAQVLLNSLNSFAHDEASLHIPVRAPENGCFVVAANKIGTLVPAHLREMVANRLKISADFLEGAGESQIVAPDGSVLVRGPMRTPAVVWADIDPREADDKTAADGTDRFATRRPGLYGALSRNTIKPDSAPAAVRVTVAAFHMVESDPQILHGLLRVAITDDAKLLVLPELPITRTGRVLNVPAAEHASQGLLTTLQRACAGSDAVIVTSIVEGGAHVAVAVDASGVRLRQPQLHASRRHAWHRALGDQINTLDLPWGRLALVAGNDALYPEVFRLLPLLGVNVCAVTTHLADDWLRNLGLMERAAENRLNVVAGTRKVHGLPGAQVCASHPDFTLWAEWETRPFDGNISFPATARADADSAFVLAPIYPAASANTMVSQRTDLVQGRPWELAGALTSL